MYKLLPPIILTLTFFLQMRPIIRLALRSGKQSHSNKPSLLKKGRSAESYKFLYFINIALKPLMNEMQS
jgi:hypothetical protein